MEIKVRKEYEVKVTRHIKEGFLFKISSSQGCIDIIPGVVEVVALGTREEINESTYDFEPWDSDSFKVENWVKYRYIDLNDWDILPLEEFIAHTSRV